MLHALFVCEGGTNTAFPYGIKDGHHHSRAQARVIAINTLHHIESAYRLWPHGDYVVYVADWWCPEECDPKGNRNLRANLKKILNKESSKK
jgi:hypothetical protein